MSARPADSKDDARTPVRPDEGARTSAPLFPHIVDLDPDAATARSALPVRGPRGTWRVALGVVLGGCAIALSIAAVRHLVADSRPPARRP